MSARESIPSRIGKYTIVRPIGEGGTAKVFLVADSSTQELFALKIIHRSLLSDRMTLLFIEEETRIHEKVQCPNIVRMHDLVFTGDLICIVLEYCEGGDLLSFITRHRNLPRDKILPFFYQMLVAVKYLHDRGIAHRDIKPENILIMGDEETVKISDLGCAVSKDVQRRAQGELCGSIFYIAPELFGDSANIDPMKVDIWALGVTLFSMVTGLLPWTSLSWSDVKKEIVEFTDISTKTPSWVQRDIAGLLTMCLQKDLARRATVDQLLETPAMKQQAQKALRKRMTDLFKQNQIQTGRKHSLVVRPMPLFKTKKIGISLNHRDSARTARI